MKKCISLLLIAVIFAPLFAVNARGLSSDALSAQCAALMCVQTGELLFEKNAHQRRAMASTTKIMTSLLALEELNPSRQVKVSAKMLGAEGTSLGLADKDMITLEDLVYGMLLESGNHAADVTALAVAGSVQKFAARMNEKAKQIGMKNTNFVTPSGLDDDNHYSTAYDMALLGCYAVRNPAFLKICSKKKAVISFGNPPYEHTVYNHNRLLGTYDGACGIKTGFTKKSGRCLVSCAEKGGIMLVAVTLNAPADWSDHKKLLDYGFTAAKSAVAAFDNLIVPVVGGVKDTVGIRAENVTIAEGVTTEILIEKFLYAPVACGTLAGEIRCIYKGKVTGSIPLVVSEGIDYLPVDTEQKEEKQSFIHKLFGKIKRN